jgi:RimJ/RimL family protein N-acetyltransferase
MLIQNDRPIGCCWANEKTPAILFPGVRVPLEIGDVYIHTWFVSQLNRSQKIGETLAYYQLLFLQERGYKRAIATVEKANLAALKIHKKIGCLTLGELSGLRFLTWSRLNYKWYYYGTRPISPAPNTV